MAQPTTRRAWLAGTIVGAIGALIGRKVGAAESGDWAPNPYRSTRPTTTPAAGQRWRNARGPFEEDIGSERVIAFVDPDGEWVTYGFPGKHGKLRRPGRMRVSYLRRFHDPIA